MLTHSRKMDSGSSVQLGSVITPMLDMTFQLLFFFVMMFKPASAMEGKIEFQLPASGEAKAARIEDVDPSKISDADLAYVNVASAYPGVLTSMNDLNGLEARRVLHAGEAVRPDDVRRPILVTKGATVTMTFQAPGITLTAVGRAMSEGGLGEAEEHSAAGGTGELVLAGFTHHLGAVGISQDETGVAGEDVCRHGGVRGEV